MTDPRLAPEQLQESGEKLIVALDVDSADAARRVIADLSGVIDTFKIGLQLFSAAGPAFVHELVESGNRVFLDLKFHDIPNTVAAAGLEAVRLGVWMFNVHASGGSEMMKRTVGDVGEFCTKSSLPLPRIIGVTVLTSSSSETLGEVGLGQNVDAQVIRLAQLAERSGLHGVVASANEAKAIRNAVVDRDFLLVTPGIRPFSATNHDQKRVMTPGDALSSGSNYLVIGRPIIAASDPRLAAATILEEMKASRS